MSIVKTELRNKMNDEWMNHRLVCYIERDVFASIDDIKIIQCYQKMRKQKGLLPRALRDSGIFILQNIIRTIDFSICPVS